MAGVSHFVRVCLDNKGRKTLNETARGMLLHAACGGTTSVVVFDATHIFWAFYEGDTDYCNNAHKQ